MDVLTALRADSGVVCAVGAGGKKTTLYALADRAADRRDGTLPVVTATVRIPIFDPQVDRVEVTEDPAAAVEAAASAGDTGPLGVVPEREGSDRYRGYDPSVVGEVADVDGVGPVLVKADGARTRLFKAPGDREPQLPTCADTVVPIASARAVGKPLADDHVHRPERVAELTGLRPGDRIRADDVASVLASRRGGLSGVPDGATPVPLVNMVDDESLRAVGEEIAAGVLDRTDAVSRVVLARMNAPDPVVDVVE
ncbi:selenium cofactor biosynthesis protein YqeC [Halorussus marinus]|uniref:selenium cofactor biosynthesis protein YqeC n=1 Tax=Halorussus marinus TaxID=2505976 RepID=UPI00106DF58E|nr:selenium cofactor biosynthesis protein YqeC [Halorussus marinus]